MDDRREPDMVTRVDRFADNAGGFAADHAVDDRPAHVDDYPADDRSPGYDRPGHVDAYPADDRPAHVDDYPADDRSPGYADDLPAYADGYPAYADDRSLDRDDLIFGVFALVAGSLLALYYAPLGLITVWVFTVAAWVRHRHPLVRWMLTFVAAVLLIGVLLITATS